MKEPNLLDVFAVFAMHAMLQRIHQIDPRDLAEMSFEIARAMLAESIEAEHGQAH